MMRKILYLVCVCAFLIMGERHGMAQESRISGTVVDENNQPVPGVTVKLKQASFGTVTDVDGKFTLERIFDGKMLAISFVGRKTVEMPARNNMQVVLYPANEELETVVVQVAYGSQKRNALTGSVGVVSKEDISHRPVTNVTSALEGKIPGVLVNSTYGQPGEAPDIRIRGFGSVNGENNPLYVVDGIPFAGNLSELNPDDVESISVLKDASAAALYGNRAANGVVLITLKKARSKQLSMEFNVRQGLYLRGMRDYERVGTDDFMKVMWKAYRNSLMTSKPKDYPTVEAANAKTTASLVESILKYNIYNLPDDQLFDAEGNLAEGAAVRDLIGEDLDWLSPMERKGYRQEYSLNGGAMLNKSDYHFSLGYLSEDGYLKNADFDRLSARLQLNLFPRQWLEGGLSLSGAYQNQNITDGMGNTMVNVFNIARYIAPIYPLHLHDPETGDYVLDEEGNRQYDDGVAGERPQYPKRNIVWENESNRNRQTKTVLSGQAYAGIKLPKGFAFTLKGNLYLSGQERNKLLSPEIGDGAGSGVIYNYRNDYRQYSFQQQFSWNRQFGNHRTELLLAHENYYYQNKYAGLAESDQILPGNIALSNFITMKSISGYPLDYRTESYLGRVRYQYGGKYFAEAAFRRDGSSRFHPDHRWGNFGSAGLSWIISEENLLESSEWLDFLKLRLSYGEVGNDASVDYYAWMSLYKIVTDGESAALYRSQNAAENIKWETTASWNAALDATLFDRWNFTVEYFDKRSRDLLFNVTLPLSAGASSAEADKMASITRNLGSVSNRGWEISTDVDIVRSGGWRWNVGANATFLKNKIITLPEENRGNGIIVPGQDQKYMEGHSVYEWWLPLYAGVDRLTGNSLYLPDAGKYYFDEPEEGKTLLPKQSLVKIGDEYYTTNTSYARRDWCGSALPKVYGSFSSRLEWKGLALSALFTYSVGGKVYDKSYSSLMSVGTAVSAVHRDVLNSWDGAPEGMPEDSPERLDPDGIPVLNRDLNANNNAVSSRFLIDGSYLWIKNIALSYTLAGSLVRKLDLQSIRLNVTMENIAIFTKRQGMNPQQSFRGLSQDFLMAPRVLSLGITIKL